MTRLVSLCKWLVLSVTLLTTCCDVTLARCPWNEPGLSPWSKKSTWGGGKEPGAGAEVTISKRVLLDKQPPDLTSITIMPGGALVWDNVKDIVLNVSYILVRGEFHIGSEDCRFWKKATINLYGRSDSKHEVKGYGRKFLVVVNDGTLEMHGQEKMSWTKLAHTIPPAQQFPCGLIYEHQKVLMGREPKSGLHVMLWNADGTVRDFGIFNPSNYDSLPEFLSSLPEGTVVAAAVKRTLGALTPFPESLYVPFEELGAKSIRAVSEKQNYAFLVKTGETKAAKEHILSDEYLHLSTPRGLEFSVASLANGDVDFKVIDTQLANPIITVADDVSSWVAGDKILVTSTDYDWRQVEVKQAVECPECAPNQIKLDTPFVHMHYGEVTLRVDERAEVALLSRNILVQGQLEDECYFHRRNDHEKWLCETFKRDLFGGQIKALMGSTVHVEGVELFQMGQQNVEAAYPLHFHMMNDASGMWFKNNSIHHTLARCVTVHATHNAEVSDNVCYLHLGHGYFLEDAVEQNITLDRNLGVGTLHGSLLLSDKHQDWCRPIGDYCDKISTFWLTHPNNKVTRNAAAGSDGIGFFYVFADAPLGVSKHAPWILETSPNNSAQYYPLKEFSDNIAHSNFRTGVYFDSRISNGEMDGRKFIPENGILPVSPNYDPRDPPNEHGVRVWTQMKRLTLYRNMAQNAWLKGGNIRLVQSSFGDSQRSFSGGTIGRDTGIEVKDSVFVAQTDNPGEGSTYIDRKNDGLLLRHYFNHSFGRNPYESWNGVEFYQGPMNVENCHFSRYGNYWWADEVGKIYGIRPVRPGAALSFRRNNVYPTKPWCNVMGLKFDSCDGVNDANWVFHGNLSTYGWKDRDGNKAPTFHDVDGSVTGQKNTQVVLDLPFYTGPECVQHSNWGMIACPYKYAQVLVAGTSGVLSRNKRRKSPLIMTRDDDPDNPLIIEGTQLNKFLMRTGKSYSVNFNKELGPVPKFLEISAFGLEKGDVIRMALCLPNTTKKFDIRSNYPVIDRRNPHIMASSLEELDEDVTGRKFYWDEKIGLLYFKLISNETRQNNTEECANSKCVRYKITRLDKTQGRTDCRHYAIPPYVDKRPVPTPPVPKACNGPQSADGLGAVPEHVVTASPFGITCPSPAPAEVRSAREYRGCFKDKPALTDMPHAPMDLSKSMTRQFCQDRCYYRGYVFAALRSGQRCSCGDVMGMYGTLADDRCSTACAGDRTITCGGGDNLEIYTTGHALKEVPTSCGPNGVGEVVDGKCLYLQQQLLEVGDAQRVCARLGGDLVAINSQEKQAAVEYYLRDRMVNEKVWIGLNQVRNSEKWEQRDGTLLGKFTFWKGDSRADSEKRFVYLSGPDIYKWIQSKGIIQAAPLCDLPLSPLPLTEPCGQDGQGRRLSAGGSCYKLLHDRSSQESADYACHLAGGTLTSFDTRQAEEETAHVLYHLGADQDYWLSIPNKVMMWTNQIFASQRVPKTAVAGALCELDPADNGQACPTDWVENQGSCYLFMDTEIKSYRAGAALCETGNGKSHVVRVDTAAENTFLTNFIASSSTSAAPVLLSLRYSSRRDDFTWGNGEPATFAAWGNGQGTGNLAGGLCAVLDVVTSGSWANANCDSMGAKLVCEMPAAATV